MAKKYQTGIITLLGNNVMLSNTSTLDTAVVKANAFVKFTYKSGATTERPDENEIRVELTNSTTVTAFRAEVSTNEVVVQWEVVENQDWNVQHFSIHQNAITVATAITAVDLAYSFVIYNGLTKTPQGTRNGQVFVSPKLTSTTAVTTYNDFYLGGTGPTVSFCVVEMSADYIASVQAVNITQSATTLNTTISAVDTAKTLMFMSTDKLNGNWQGNYVPAFSLTSSTNIQSVSVATTASNEYHIYVVEFVDMAVVHGSTTYTAAATTVVLGATPTHGGININSADNRQVRVNTWDDSKYSDRQVITELAGDTWTITKTDAVKTTVLSYSTFDWSELLIAPVVITSINGVSAIKAGQTNIDIVGTGFGVTGQTTKIVKLGGASGELVTINSWADTLINIDIPLHIDVENGSLQQLYVENDVGSGVLNDVSFLPNDTWEVVTFNGVAPDAGTTESFYELAQADVDVGNIVMAAGDKVVFESSAGFSVDSQTIIYYTSDSNGAYKIWDASLGQHTGLSSYATAPTPTASGGILRNVLRAPLSSVLKSTLN